MAPAILWLRRNLRLSDNASLIAAAESGAPLIPVYVLDELDAGGASRWWLHYSLMSLSADLRHLGSSLIVLTGAPETVLPRLVERCGATSLYYTRRVEPAARRQEESLRAALVSRADMHAFDDSYLSSYGNLLTKAQSPFRVFTPYWKSAIGRVEPAPPRPAPKSINSANHGIGSMPLGDLNLVPTDPDWAEGFRKNWAPGESGAMQRLDNIEFSIENYAQHRDRPDLEATSRLSPHLHFGEISVRQVWHAIQKSVAHMMPSGDAAAFSRQLYWRDFSAYLLFHFPDLPNTPLRREFRNFPWSSDATRLRAWQQGVTGYPIVDAGMRQLWATGWMHNRVRMIVASFLVKHLLVPWQQGASWFLDTLVDADLASNAASWQWVAGCGTDAAPYFRIFNPVLQGKKFDPDGSYVRRWVPELSAMPNEYIHEPWLAYRQTRLPNGVSAGDDYPGPIVDHGEARREALAAYQLMRSAANADAILSGQRDTRFEGGTAFPGVDQTK